MLLSTRQGLSSSPSERRGEKLGRYFQVGCRRTGRGAKPYDVRAGHFVQEAELCGDEQVSSHKDAPRDHFISSYAR